MKRISSSSDAQTGNGFTRILRVERDCVRWLLSRRRCWTLYLDRVDRHARRFPTSGDYVGDVTGDSSERFSIAPHRYIPANQTIDDAKSHSVLTHRPPVLSKPRFTFPSWAKRTPDD